MKMLCQVQLSKHRYKTPEGYLICYDCILARTGKQTYLQSELYGITEGEDRYIDVDRKADQVFNEKTMASFEGKPLTIEHPDVSVSPENYKELSVGNVHNIHRGTFDGNDVMYGDITVYDAEAIALIESGEMTELSCGYDCDITDGPNPEQINIRGNHIALCEQGRAGIARIQDSKKKPWGATPIVKDSVQKGTLIQEFGAYGKQYKVSKIQGNVLYCEELQSGKTFLFKKDKENVDWATINKADVKDSASNVDLLRSKTKHWTLDLDHDTLCVTLFGLENRSSAALDHRFNDKVYDTFEEALADAEKLFAEYKDKKEITDTRYGYYSINIVEWQEGAGNCVDENDKNIGSMPAFSAFDQNEIKGRLREAMKQQGYIRDSEEPVRYMVSSDVASAISQNSTRTMNTPQLSRCSSTKNPIIMAEIISDTQRSTKKATPKSTAEPKTHSLCLLSLSQAITKDTNIITIAAIRKTSGSSRTHSSSKNST